MTADLNLIRTRVLLEQMQRKHPTAIDPARALAVAIRVYDHLPADQKRQWATARRRATA